MFLAGYPNNLLPSKINAKNASDDNTSTLGNGMFFKTLNRLPDWIEF